MKKKTRWMVGGLAAVFLVLGLWYTRPRSFSEITGQRPIAGFGMYVIIKMYEEDGRAVYEKWEVDNNQRDSQLSQELQKILENCRYRVRLKSLFPTNQISLGHGTTADVMGSMEDGGTFSAAFGEEGAWISVGNTSVLCRTDDGILDELVRYSQAYGEKIYSR